MLTARTAQGDFVLDNKVLSAPNIRTEILGGSGQISGSFTVETASTLALQLRSGALPAKLAVAEERTVGADLGADAIRSGTIAALVGTALVVVFMLFAYGPLFGGFAATGAIARTESRGAHQREDFERMDERWTVNQVLTLDGGDIAISRQKPNKRMQAA